jgi:hypothetical protein
MGCYQTKIIGIDEKENEKIIPSWKESIQLGCYRNNIPPELVAIILHYRYGVPKEFGNYQQCAKCYRPKQEEHNVAFVEILDEFFESFIPGSLGYVKLDC